MKAPASSFDKPTGHMDLKQLTLLLPCHSLEDFPTHHKADDALDLLLAWTTLWHPVLLNHCGHKPQWLRCEQPLEDCQDHAIVVPLVSKNRLPSGFTARCEEQNGFTLHSTMDRDADVQTLLNQFGLSQNSVADDYVREFYALSYTYLQIQLLTRQLRYSSNLDEVHFETQLLKAAKAACEDDRENFELALERCYDVLSEERHRYYPTASYLVDLTLLGPTTLGKRLQNQLKSQQHYNYLVNQELIEQLRDKSAENLDLLKQQHQAGNAGLVGGGRSDSATGLLSYQSLLQDFVSSQAYFQQQFGEPLKIFARRTSGLEQTLPSILSFTGFHAAIHETFEEAKIPSPTSTNFRWQGPDGQFLNSLTKTVLDASDPNVFLKLGIQIGEALDIDHIAIMQLVHWPDQACPVYQDLILSAKRCDALGQWSTYAKVFGDVHEPGYGESINSTEYRTNYLADTIQSCRLENPNDEPTSSEVTEPSVDPIQSTRQLLEREEKLCQTNGLAALAQLSSGANSISQLADFASKPATDRSGAAGMLENHLATSLTQIDENEAANTSRLIFNPTSQPQRFLLTSKELKGLSLENVPAGQIYHTCKELTGTWAVLDLPAMGYIHLTAGKMKIPTEQTQRQKQNKQSGKILSTPTTLRNEFLEATIDADTGSIRSIHNYEKRGNLCSLQLAWYDAELKKQIAAALKKDTPSDWRENLAQLWKTKGDARERELANHVSGYSRMEVQSIKTITNNSAVGAIRVTGRLMVRKKAIAEFILDYQLIRGARFVEVRSQITPHHQPEEIKLGKKKVYYYPPDSEKNQSGYRHYFTWRLAHSQPAADQYRDLNSLRQPAPHGKFVAPQMVEWIADHRLTWLCHRNAFHKIPADGKLDTLIGLDNSNVYHSKVAIGLGPKHSLGLAATSAFQPKLVPCGKLKSGVPASAWLFQCSSRHVLAIDWQLQYEKEQFIGIKLRLLETGNKDRKLRLDFAVAPTLANACGNDPNYQPKCKIEDTSIHCDIGPFEMLELDIKFA